MSFCTRGLVLSSRVAWLKHTQQNVADENHLPVCLGREFGSLVVTNNLLFV